MKEKKVTVIGYSSFEYCKKLKFLTIADSITSIEDWAFSNCESLSSVIIPSSVKTIGGYAFCNCINLEKFAYPIDAELGELILYCCSKLKTIKVLN